MRKKAAAKVANPLADVMAGLNAKFGADVVKSAGDMPNVSFYSSGLPSFDVLVGGIPVGRLVLISGLPATGKSTFCYKCMGLAKMSLLLDAEGSYTPEWGSLFGLSDENLIVARPKDMEEAYNIVDHALSNYELDYIVVDSAASMSSRSELGRPSDEQGGFGERAILNNALCRRVVARTRLHERTTVVMIQHLYEDPNGTAWKGPALTLAGGRTQTYLNSAHIQFSRAKVLTDTIEGEGDTKEKRTIGFMLRWKIDHSKVCPDGAQGLWRLYTRNSLNEELPRIGTMDDAPEFLRLCQMTGTLTKRGSWYFLWEGEEREEKCQGEVGALAMMAEHSDELIELVRAVVRSD